MKRETFEVRLAADVDRATKQMARVALAVESVRASAAAAVTANLIGSLKPDGRPAVAGLDELGRWADE